jgi:hypothetical protein
MNDVTRILSAIEQGDPRAAGELLPLVYGELRRLAKQRLAREKPGQTLQDTALVHEAYLRLVHGEAVRSWEGRGISSPRRPRRSAVSSSTTPAASGRRRTTAAWSFRISTPSTSRPAGGYGSPRNSRPLRMFQVGGVSAREH